MIRSLRRAADHRRQADGRYGWLFNPYTGDEMVAIGCETSGLDPRSAGLVSIGAVRLTSERVLIGDSLNLSLHGDPGEPEALGERLETLLDFIGNRPLLGWRIGFDRAVIDRHLRSHFGFDLPNATLDMAQVYRREMRRVSLRPGSDPCFEALAKSVDVPITNQRCALDEALTTASLYVQLKKDALVTHRC